jgi:hypothetical protein
MVEYSHEIFRLYTAPSKNGLSNVVTGVNWRYQIKEDSYYADTYLVTNFLDPDPEKFIQYNGLTNEIVFTWIQDAEDFNQLKLNLQEKLTKVKNPEVIEKHVPWDQSSKYTGNEEYLLVFDNQPNDPLKIWGPMQWDSRRANNGLKERGVEDFTFPEDVIMYQKGLLPETNSVVNERTQLYRVEYIEKPQLDDLFQYHERLTWVTDSGKAVGTYFVIDQSLEDSKKEVIQRFENQSFEQQNSGADLTIQGKTVKVRSDFGTRTSLLQQWILANETDIIKCKLNEFVWVNVSKSELKTIIDELNNHVQSFLDQESEIVEQVNACETVEELKTIVENSSIGKI